ncbi:MAG TPA: hypothetical protein VHV55_15405 [Pirellulales bacterium]|nr:hypothetical protein [Pirellulales bacterium]
MHASVQAGSFAGGADILAEQAELKIGVKRLWRAVQRIGEERLAEEQAAAEAFEKLPLPAQQHSPVEQVPTVACVEMDGGRLQIRDRHERPQEREADATYWSEMKVGVLTSMHSEVAAVDPCPELPASFADPGKMRQIAREIKGFTSQAQEPAQTEEPGEGEDQEPTGERPGKPQPLVKSVVALVDHVEPFGRRLASAAYARGFHAAPRRAFIADGSETNWGVHRRHFSHYTPIVDFVHALMYVYAAAMAGRTTSEGWRIYRDWAQWLWSGQVELVIQALAERQAELGPSAEKETGTPRSQVAESLRYLTNQRSRMDYAQYRRQGLPITSSYVESTIKQVNRRMKGTEKFWSTGANAMLTLVADQLSQTNIIPRFWNRRLDRLARGACYHQVT